MPQNGDDRSHLLEDALIEVAVETWRLSHLFERVVLRLDAGEQGRYASQLRYFDKRLRERFESVGLKLVTLEGQPFDVGVAASALNLADFTPDEKLLVDKMVEPIVMGNDGVRRQGTLLVRKAFL